MIITPSIHYTMGGLKMNNKGEILNPENKTIYGLYGAGEVTGGVHGGNRLGGNSLAECGVYGRISADSAVEYLFNKYNNNPNNIHKFFGKTKSSKGLGFKGIISIIILIVFALISLLVTIKVLNQKKDNLKLKTLNQTTSLSNNSIGISSK